jgi:hypothetical protein
MEKPDFNEAANQYYIHLEDDEDVRTYFKARISELEKENERLKALINNE